jgi:16S rRNA (guanine527-N7)-methyltransferase
VGSTRTEQRGGCFAVVGFGSGGGHREWRGSSRYTLALARPDLEITLVEPLLRRVTFLEEIIGELGIDVRVVRGRAEEKSIIADAGDADVVTSRAVAPLAKLAGWSAPLLKVGGRMVALKGDSALEEVERDRAALDKLGFKDVHVETVSAPDAEPTRLVIGTLATRMGAVVPDPAGGESGLAEAMRRRSLSVSRETLSSSRRTRALRLR